MDFLKQFFGGDGNTAITYEQLSQGITEKGMKIANLSSDKYVEKEKLDKKIKELNDYKTESDKNMSKYADYDTIKAELEMLKTEKADRELIEKLSEKKVKPEFRKFVLSEIKSKVTEQMPFDKAMEVYLKENTQYTAEQTFFKNSSVPLDNGTGGNKSTNQKMNALFRGARN